MKICLAGNYSRVHSCASSILKVQLQLLSYLNEQGNQVVFLERSNKNNIYYKLFDNLTSLQLNEGTLIRGGVIKILFYLRRNNFDIINFMDDRYYMLLVFLIYPFIKTKIVTTFHDTLNFRGYQRKLLPHLRRLFLKRFSNLILVFSKGDQKLLQKSYHTKKVKIVRNGVDTNFFSPLSKVEESENILLYCGGLSDAYKGLDFLEASLDLVSEKYNLVICGKNSARKRHKLYIGELCPSEIKSMYQRAKILIVPSKYEAFSLTVLEAMSCGIPTILTQQCGVSEYLQDGVGCFIIDYGDTKKLAQRISVLLNDSKLWTEMSYKALKVSKLFNWKEVLGDYIKIYRELVFSEK
jgi:glycosyltransferase involved in cell wall biosynthesis